MYIAPNSKIHLLKDVPLDNRYQHTLWFADKTSQHNYFTGKIKHSFDDQSYVRLNRGYINVEIKADVCYDCNYMMYQNTSFGNKWFYAFITSVEYVNNEVTKITFDTDVMQTWLFDFDLGECFVEREHVSNDAIGLHTIPEPVTFGQEYYAHTKLSGYTLSDYWSIGVGFTKSVGEGGKVTPSIVAGVPCGTDVYVFNAWDDFKSFFSALSSESVSAVAFITMLPRELGIAIGNGRVTSDDKDAFTKVVDIPASIFTNKPGNYTPKNNKVYVYPYNYLEVQSEGSTYTYQLEKNTGSFTFNYDFAFSATPSVFVHCTSYSDQNNGFTFGAYPQIPWSGNIYSQWQIAKNVNQLNMLKGALGAGSITRLGTSLLNSVYNNAVTDDQYTRIAPSTNGASGDYAGVVSNRLHPLFNRVHLRDEPLKALDQYLTRWGYQVNSVKKPNTHSRPAFNFVKTLGCTVTGSLPADDMSLVNSIHDSGITYWTNHSAVGDYSVNNK